MLLVSLAVFGEDVAARRVLGVIEGAHSLVKPSDDAPAENFDILLPADHNKIIPSDMAQELAVGQLCRDAIGQVLDHAVPVPKAVDIVVRLEVVDAKAKLLSLSLIDELSGLYNRRHFEHLLKITIDLFTRKRLGGLKADFCLLLPDADHFKRINDRYGHVTGDAVIRYIGGQMMAYLRSSDYAFRYGGDEFALILQDTDLPAGRVIGERLRALFEHNPLVIDGTEIPLTVSLGIIGYQDEKSVSELVQKVDSKLYQAKRGGRNQLRG